MLKHYRSVEDPEKPGWFRLTSELVDDPCERCGGESVPNICEGCQKYHHHGRVHPIDGGGLMPLCRMCGELDAAAWIARREGAS